MTTNDKISALRAAAKAAGANGVLLMTSDPHSGEYLPDHYRSLTWASGFTGDNATLVITMTGSALWVDGRFYVQADKQLAGTEIESMHMGYAGVPGVEEYLAAHFGKGETLLLDGACVPAAIVQAYQKALAPAGAVVKSKDIVTPIWADCPALPRTPCSLITKAQAGFTAAEKLAQVQAELKKAGATALAVTKLDCVGWLLNLRARDLPCTPLALAYAFVTLEGCTLFLAPGRLSDADAAVLKENGVALRGYDEIFAFVRGYDKTETVLAALDATNFDLYTAMQANPHLSVRAGADPITTLKSVKNEVELANARECHVRDGVAMVRFAMDLEKAVAAGKPLMETDIEKMLQARRGEQPGYYEDSFETIAAYGANAAMMHYHAEGEVDSPLQPKGFLLVDCGGQYDCGTTDITRTYPLGPLTENERRYYTWTLQSHIDMAKAVFLDYCTGFALDTFARAPLWQHGINYRCGTGHSVSFMGSVHEGPHALRPNNAVVFKPGMVITDEPGVYEADEVGIRIESELECVEKETNQYGRFLAFSPLTLVPIELSPVLADELTTDQKNWLNGYHQRVYAQLSPRLNDEEKAWLAEKTRAI